MYFRRTYALQAVTEFIAVKLQSVPPTTSNERGMVLLYITLSSIKSLLHSYQTESWYSKVLFSSDNTATFEAIHADLSHSLATFNFGETGGLMDFADAHAQACAVDKA